MTEPARTEPAPTPAPEPAPRGSRRVAPFEWATAGLATVFVVLRLAAAWDRTPAVYPDSASYFDLRLWGAVRFPVVPLVYRVVGDHVAIVRTQAVVGALAWVAAAVVLAGLVRAPWARVGAVAAVLVLGLTGPVTTFDVAVLSESLATSATVVLVACLLRFAVRPTRGSAWAVVATGAVWGLCRQNHAVLLAVGTVVLVALGAVRSHRHLAWRVGAALGVVAVVGLALASSTSQIQEYNSAQILVRRVLADDTREAWFRAHGMPGNGDALLVPPYENRFGDPAVELQEDPRFGPWLRHEFPGVWARYLLTHPGYALFVPFGSDGASGALVAGTSGYADARAVVPGVVDTVLWPRSTTGRLLVGLVVAALAVATATAARPGGRRRVLAGGGGILIVVAAEMVFVTHTAGWEYERLLVPTGVALRLVLLLWLAVLVGGVVEPDDVEPDDVEPGDVEPGVSGPSASAGPVTGSTDPGPDRSGAAPDRAPDTPRSADPAGTTADS